MSFLRPAACVGGMVLALSSTGAWAQKASPELTACIAANRQAATDLLQARDSEIRRHALHAVLVSRLQGLGSGFNQLKANAARVPRNLAECEKTTEALNAGREQLERIVGTPEQLAECATANQTAYGQMQAVLLELQAGGKVPAARLEAVAGRLDQLRPGVNRDGQTLTDCRALSAEIETEKAAVQRLAPPPPAAPAPRPAASAPPAPAGVPPAVCRQGHTRQYNELAQAYAAFVSAGPIPQELMASLQSLSERLTRLAAQIPDTNSPDWNCDDINRALERARNDLAKLKR
ncbi:hypothetical protein [Rubrivivax rivuli]|uniref:Uncharacterized protein n=1 Tax=Rubrivivax rivuli TaxID=1862385 RepID=A0A437RFH3_9BURK|nr:hypothetical protein [Rubrivivax rivuli]RVU45516.1 hypothetical protein EOE66_15505 [Rubrivivax rivuli]